MSKNSKQVLFTILNYNGWEETLTCVDSVLKQSYQDFHILLVDNGSHDDSLEKLKKFEKHEKITFHKEPVNTGFSGGVNIGIRYALKQGFPYTVLLNNDALLSKDWLEILIKAAKKRGSTITTGLMLTTDGKTIDSTSDGYSIWGLPFPRQRNEPAESALESGYVFGGTAGASLYKTEIFKKIGLFDEKFFAYYEDTDICFRNQLVGNKVYYEKSAVVYHDHGTTSSKMPGFTVYQTFKNLPLFFWKDVPLGLLFPIGVRFFTWHTLNYLRTIARGQFIPATKGVLESILLLPYALRERRRIQKKRSVSISYLRSVIYPELPPSSKKSIQKLFGKS